MLFSGCEEKVRYDIQSADDVSASSAQEEESVRTESKSSMILVYVCGEVESEGVYELPEGSRVYEALQAAGGLLEGVDTTKINMAAKLSDGQQITVSLQGIEQDGFPGEGGSGKINLNTAGKEELMELPGIGEARAGDIIEYRQQYGSFSSIEEIMNISGIGEKMFEKIKDDIEV